LSITSNTGDTFESLSRRAYGTEKYALNLSQANPGALEPLAPGTVLAVPQIPGDPTNRPTQAQADRPNEVAVLVGGVRFRFWSELRLTRSLDSMDTLEFSAPFEPNDPAFRETFRPFSFKPLAVTVGGVPLFTGTLVGVVPVVSRGSTTVSLSGYSRPGVLEDCTPPASAFPVEFNAQDLPGIAAALCQPFGIAAVFDGPGGSVFERAAADPGEKVLGFLSGLAKQRGLVVSSDPDGRALFQQSVKPGAPVAVLRQGASPFLGVSPFFSPQQYYSHITGLESVMVGTSGSQYTVRNPYLAGVIRPHTFKSPDTQGGTVRDSVRAKAGRMFGNMAAYGVQVDTWRDPSGALWRPNTTVVVNAPGAMIYSDYEFVVRSVRFDRTGDNESAELDLVLPGAFSGETPETLPWD
jgi:prophage tail gpP-like protein